MRRRLSWLAVGAALGAGTTVWAQHRLAELRDRLSDEGVAREVARGVTTGVGRGTRRVWDRARGAVHAGRSEARRREDELWREISGPHPLQRAG